MKKRQVILPIMAGALFFGLAFWALDAAIGYYYFGDNLRFMMFRRPASLLDSLVLNVAPYALFVRISFLVASLATYHFDP